MSRIFLPWKINSLNFICLPVMFTRPARETCFQRLSNNHRPDFTDQELVAIYLFGHLQGLFEKKAIYKLIDKYWRHYFPRLPAYQTFVARFLLLEQTFQTIGGYLNELLAKQRTAELDHIIDSLPVMLAKGGHADTARVARDVATLRLLRQQKALLSRRSLAHHRTAALRSHPTARAGLAQRRQLS